MGRVSFGWGGGEDSGCADFEGEGCVLGEVEGEDVLVVGDCDDRLQDEDAGAGYDGILRAEVRVLP